MALVRVKSTFAVLGDPRVWPEGRIVEDSHPVVRKHPTLFEPVESAVFGGVEQATAAPGEKRSTPAKKAPAKKAAPKADASA